MGNPCPACLLEEASQVGKSVSELTPSRHLGRLAIPSGNLGPMAHDASPYSEAAPPRRRINAR
jgi:hypothetical protein